MCILYMNIIEFGYQVKIHNWRLNFLFFGLIAGAVSSLLISSMILLAEKVIGYPVGTFYLVIIDTLLNSSSTSIIQITYGFALHILTGTLLGMIMSIPFLIRRSSFLRLTQYSQLYGVIFGLFIWAFLFVPVSILLVFPEISQLGMVIFQQTPTGAMASLNTKNLQDIMWEIMFIALPFNMFYGLVAGIIVKALNERYINSLKNSQLVINK
jgi:hypothetical protein